MQTVEELRKLVSSGDFSEFEKAITAYPELITGTVNRASWVTSLLLTLCELPNREMLTLLLEKGANCQEQPRNPLKVYIESGYGRNGRNLSTQEHLAMLQLLFAHGVKLEFKERSQCATFIRDGMRRLFHDDEVEIFELLTTQGVDFVAMEAFAQVSLLEQCMSEQRYCEKPSRLFTRLLDLGCSLDGFAETSHFCPLRMSLSVKRYDYTAILLDRGAMPTRCGLWLLTELPRYETAEMPEELLARLCDGFDVNEVNRYGESPFTNAVKYDRPDLIIFYSKRGALLNAVDGEGQTPLHSAIKTNSKKSITTLIELGADLNTLNRDGKTPLDIALTLSGFKRVSETMKKAGAKTSAELNAGGNERDQFLAALKSEFMEGEPWAEKAHEYFSHLDSVKLLPWHELARHCLDNNSSKPSSRWLTQANKLIERIGVGEVRECLLQWFPLVKETRSKNLPADQLGEMYMYGSQAHIISENNTRLLKGLAWLSSRFSDNAMSSELRQLAANMYKKVYGVGMRNSKVANAALNGLAEMAGDVGVKEIVVLRAATKYNPALVNINRIFERVASERKVSGDELAAMAVPDYGLTDVGECVRQIGDYEAVLTLTAVGKTQLVWRKGDKEQKSVPAVINQSFTDELKLIKAQAKDIQVGSRAHNQRIEMHYLSNQKLELERWLEQYMNHRLIGFIARRLIWRVSTVNGYDDIFYLDGGYVDRHNRQYTVPESGEVTLWHPSMSSADDVAAWRVWLSDRDVTQPFKQAYREIYLLTDAERLTGDHSMRFANHLLLQHQFHALAEQRGWQQQRGGGWDGGHDNYATKKIPSHDISVFYNAVAAEEYGYMGALYTCVITSEVSFYQGNARVRLEALEPLMFSEVMRDIDLFVGVAGVGNDPEWLNREDLQPDGVQYWNENSFGELSQIAKTRKEALQILVPKLKIANQLRLEDRFLVVEGKLKTYRIHIGSTNILMEPDNSYLCIVAAPSASKSKVMLPFEGDTALSLILSKAMLLARDDKITDPVILSQFER